ncbi:hypothetical protein BG003_006380 [Podila horticola]|nr:hypothetical protein BG003_006380 [Podila horticola]
MDNHIVVNQLWGPQASFIYKCHNPILQFHHNINHPDYMNAYFTEKVFVAPFNLLWSVEKLPKENGIDYIQPTTKVPSVALWKIFFYLARHELNPRNHVYVYPHYYTLDMLKYPAIEPLIQYKWNKFAYRLWLARFSILFCYYSLIVIAAVMQIYSDDPDSLFYVFVAIVVLSLWFLTLELFSSYDLKKARDSVTYESVDPKRLGYFSPIGGQYQLADKHISERLKWNHLGPECLHYHHIPAYALRGGRYDPVRKEPSEGPNAAMQVILVIYFFFTVILMLNVLIALINSGFNQGDGTWRLVWLENRLRYVESAEEMTYHIPDWFPREINYTATKEQVVEYENKMLKKNGSIHEILEKHRLESEKQMETRFDKLEATVYKRTAIAEGRTGVNVGNDATREDVTGPVGHSSSGNRQDPPQKAEGNAATQNEEERHGQTELHRLRAQVGDLVRQQADLLSKATSSSNRPSSSNNSTTAASTTSGWNEC